MAKPYLTTISSRKLAQVAWEKRQKPINIIMVSVKSGDSKTFAIIPFDRLDSWGIPMTISPNGKFIICAVTEMQSDIWLMENLDPEVE